MTSIALVGNPNSGKSALFNRLTGSDQRVGNWSGVTVEKKVGTCTFAQHAIEIIDLPGIYSLLAHEKNSIDEQISTQCLLEDSIDGMINIIDASRLERHLFLTLQLLETKIPMVVALNMVDVLDHQHGQTVDIEKLSKQLGCPVIAIQAHKGQGMAQAAVGRQRGRQRGVGAGRKSHRRTEGHERSQLAGVHPRCSHRSRAAISASSICVLRSARRAARAPSVRYRLPSASSP